MQDETIDRLDGALVHLRRLWSGPPQPLGNDARDVDLSSILMLEAWAQLADDAGAVGVGDLARFAAVQPSTATRLLDRAVAAGLVERVPSPADARIRLVRATPEGREVRARAVLLRTTWLRHSLDDWPSADVDRFSTLLERFADTVREHGGPAAS